MYKKILVPLDGSDLAECVLPYVEGFLAGFPASTIALVRVLEPESVKFDDTAMLSSTGRDSLIEYTRRIEEKKKSAAADYLENIADRLKRTGVESRTEVLIGSVADRLAEYTETNDIDLIIIATHGRSGISRWVRGSVADRVLRFSRVPVLMVRADGSKGRHQV